MPPVVYAPCMVAEDGTYMMPLRETNDGRTALLVYTALDRLVQMAGDVHWALLDWDGLEEVRRSTHFDVILQDVWIPEDKR